MSTPRRFAIGALPDKRVRVARALAQQVIQPAPSPSKPRRKFRNLAPGVVKFARSLSIANR